MTGGINLGRPEDFGLSRERLARIGDALAADVEAGRLPGAVTLVARRGRVVHFKAYGRRDPALPDPMPLDAIFRIYSMTKPIVSAALMMMVEEGRVGLADPISDYLPAFADVTVGTAVDGEVRRRPPLRPITIHDLLRHTSGLTYEWFGDGPVHHLYAEAGLGRRSDTNADAIARLAALPLLADPGDAWHYSRSTDVIGRVIEIVSNRTLGQHLADHLFEPLGMVDTGFSVPEPDQPRLAEPLGVDPDSHEPVSLLDVRRTTVLESAGGGLVSTAPDYARFLHMLCGHGDGLLGRATIRFMTADHLAPDVAVGSDLLPPGYGFGLGFAVRRGAGLAPFPGSPGDYYWEGLGGTSFWVDPAEDLYAILMIQAPGRRAHYRRMFRSLVYAAIVD